MSRSTKDNIPPDASDFTTISALEFLCTKPAKDKETYECECGGDSPCDESTCYNRAIYIECTKRCSRGERCCNRRLQKRKFADVCVKAAGKKGHGLFLGSSAAALEADDLIGEYVGEVYDTYEFERRKEEYRRKGSKHLYFMNLDADHIIDSTRKGAITRFVNHSCDPNMDLQKWTVNGEPRIGFFASRPIEAGEELTIDYKYDRIDDDEHLCYCGSANCRGELDAKQDVRGGAGAAERALKKLTRSLDALCNEERKLDPSGVLEFLKLMRSEFQANHRAAVLEVLGGSAELQVLNSFLRFRGLQFLRMYLESFIEVGDEALLTSMMHVLKLLPVGTKNVVNQSGILPFLEGLRGFGDESIASDATALAKQWSELEEVAVIEKHADAADPIELAIPRKWLGKFRESSLRSLEQRTGAKLAFTRDNHDPINRQLKLSGTEAEIAAAKLDVEQALATAAVEEVEKKSRGEEEAVRAAEVAAKVAETRKRRLSSEGEAAAANDRADDSAEALLEGWEKAFDKGANKYYYYNSQNTADVRWEPPQTPIVQKAKRLNSLPDKLAISAADPMMIEAFREESRPARSSRSGAVATEAEIKGQRMKMKKGIAECVGKILKRYRQKDCTVGRISSDSDYKHLCRRITHEIMKKEEGPDVDDATRHKIKNFVKGYMKKIGPNGFSRSASASSPPH